MMAYQPRSYQRRFLEAMAGGKTRAVLVWHRRAGKDLTVLNFVANAMLVRPGVYYYFLPTYAQAKKILWDGIDGNGQPFLGTFRKELIAARHETELKITYHPTRPGDAGSVFQLIGGDNIDTVVGTNPVGVILSEYALMDPRAWDLVRPILAENGGWAVFVYTPRGRNHGLKLWQAAQDDPETWYADRQTVETTRRDAPNEGGGPVVSEAQVEQERRSGMPEELIQQEFYCSFEGAMVGTFYGDLISQAFKDGRVGDLPYYPDEPVTTAWDLGVDDASAIVFTQTIDGWVHWIDYLEAHSVGLEWYAKEVRQRPFVYDRHLGPHDLRVRDWSVGEHRYQAAARLGIHFTVLPRLPLQDGIQAVRRLLPRSRFHGTRCKELLDKLLAYRREWDEKNAAWRPTPVHDAASHAADAVRYRALGEQAGYGTQTLPAFAEMGHRIFGEMPVSQQVEVDLGPSPFTERW